MSRHKENSSYKFFEEFDDFTEDKHSIPITLKSHRRNHENYSQLVLSPWGQQKKTNFNIRRKNYHRKKDQCPNHQNQLKKQQLHNEKQISYVAAVPVPKDQLLEIKNQKVKHQFLKAVKNYRNIYLRQKNCSLQQPKQNSISITKNCEQKVINVENKKFSKQQEQQISEMEQLFKQQNFSNKFHILWENMQQKHLKPILKSPERIKIINFPLTHSEVRLKSERQRLDCKNMNNTFYLKTKLNSTKDKFDQKKRENQLKYIIVKQSNPKVQKTLKKCNNTKYQVKY